MGLGIPLINWRFVPLRLATFKSTPMLCRRRFDDADSSTFPGATEICNGKLDDCLLDDGTLAIPTDEVDFDEDTFLDCAGKVFDPTLWVGDIDVLNAFG